MHAQENIATLIIAGAMIPRTPKYRDRNDDCNHDGDPGRCASIVALLLIAAMGSAAVLYLVARRLDWCSRRDAR
jgi:hypothetical protein